MVSRGSNNSKVCSLIYLVHLLDLRSTVGRIQLVDTELIHPEVAVT